MTDESWLIKTLKQLNLTDSMEQKEGFSRLSYSEEEWKSIAVFQEKAEEIGLDVRRDEAGNCIARWNGVDDDQPAFGIGSHLDTVKNGGGYDGVAGVLCSLAAVKALKEEEFQPNSPIEVICFASEESSRFGVSTVGSKAMSGLLEQQQLEQIEDDDGITIKEAVESRGLSWDQLPRAERKKEELRQFVELHIEQGTRIEDAGKSFGVATAIACPTRLKIDIIGKSSHTGTTPMAKRQDALVVAAPIISFISERAGQLSEENEVPVVATTSMADVFPNKMTSIPGRVELGVDIRSVSDALKRGLAEEIEKELEKLAEAYQVDITPSRLVDDNSVFLDEKVAETLKETGEQLGFGCLVMESGAGHDVMNMASRWPTGLIFIPCRDGLSHHPDESASEKDLEIGVDIIKQYLKNETKIPS
ncbi:M20 family metallo-hydrolase [Alkalihalobacillus sp. TS-13]|uniref:M20 family metallo-hydrolase n=1 Tax=Alkalihalobacillus sp. TS-13 TaxID=2842455 RepID=UPI001C868AF7|nr:M20 family metallo-hydrolase [Alkalihalobacillus sp. TS-13]